MMTGQSASSLIAHSIVNRVLYIGLVAGARIRKVISGGLL